MYFVLCCAKLFGNLFCKMTTDVTSKLIVSFSFVDGLRFNVIYGYLFPSVISDSNSKLKSFATKLVFS